MTRPPTSRSAAGDWLMLAFGCLLATPGVLIWAWVWVTQPNVLRSFGAPASLYGSLLRTMLVQPYTFLSIAGALLAFIAVRRLRRRRAAARLALRERLSVFDG